jgi:cytochrome c5
MRRLHEDVHRVLVHQSTTLVTHLPATPVKPKQAAWKPRSARGKAARGVTLNQ